MLKNKISTDALRLIVGSFFYRGGKVVFSTFINIFIWKITGDIQLLVLFNIITLVFHLVGFLIGSSYVKKGYYHQVSTFSLLGLIATFIFMFFTIENVDNLYWVYSLIFGLFNGFFYSSLNVRAFSATTFKNRGNYQGTKKSTDVTGKVIFPLIVGGIISIFTIKGALLFGIITYFIGVGALYYKDKNISKSRSYSEFFDVVKKNRKIQLSLLSAFFFQLAFAIPVLELLISVTIFERVGTELSLGASLSFISVVSILLMYLFGKYITYKQYHTALFIVNAFYIVALLLLVHSESLFIVLTAASIISGAMAMYALMFGVIANNSLHSVENYREHNVSYSVAKELAYFSGWIIAFLIIYFSGGILQDSLKILFYSFIVISIIPTILLTKIDMHKIEE